MTMRDRNNGAKTATWTDLCRLWADTDAGERHHLAPLFAAYLRSL